MSTYEHAPATAMVATNCACCGRPLVDAVSVEKGMGPTCRARHGYDDEPGPARFPFEPTRVWDLDNRIDEALGDGPTPDARRHAANVIVHWLACQRSADGAVHADPAAVLRACVAVRALGFERLGDILVARTAAIRIEDGEGCFVVRAPYDPAFADALKAARVGARWAPKPVKAWTVPSGENGRRALWNALRAAFRGVTGVGPRGVFVVA